MGDIQWGLLDPNSFQRGYQQGKVPIDEIVAQQKKNALDAAMRQYALHPDDPKAVNALALVDPTAAVTAREHQQTFAAKQLEQHRESIKIGAQVISSIKPHDEPSWQQARQIYAQAGGDLKDVPAHWDETTAQYVQHIGQLASVLSPEKQGQLVPYAPGGGVARLNPQTGQLENLVLPNEGGHPTGAPAGNVPQVTDQASYDAIPLGSQYMAPDGHIRVKQGGQTQPASGGFPY